MRVIYCELNCKIFKLLNGDKPIAVSAEYITKYTRTDQIKSFFSHF